MDRARHDGAARDAIREGQDAVYRFLTVLGGDSPGYEEACRALYAGDAARFAAFTAHWPPDVRDHAWRLAPRAFGYAPSPLDAVIPFDKRPMVTRALEAAFRTSEVEAAERLPGAGSGARVYKIGVGGADYALRIDAPQDRLRNEARHYTCLKIASDAGVAPKLLHADATTGIAVVEFVGALPRTNPSLPQLGALIDAVKTLHATPLFPGLMSYLDLVDVLVQTFRTTHLIPAKRVSEYLYLYETLAAAYPREDPERVSSHNDLNISNVLFEGTRAWIIDWESAFAGDRYVDLATVANFFAADEAQERFLVEAYFGAGLNDYRRSRFFLMQQINRMFYALVLLNNSAAERPELRLTEVDLRTPRFHEARHDLRSMLTVAGRLRFGCIFLNEMLHHVRSPRFAQAAQRVRARLS